MFLKDNILTDKSVSTLLTDYTLNNLTIKVLQIFMLIICCSVIMMKKTLLLNELSL